MGYFEEYPLAMDFVREKLGLHPTVSLYEAVVKFVSEYKKIEEELQKCQIKKTKSKSTK